jgi:hypothetical protein
MDSCGYMFIYSISGNLVTNSHDNSKKHATTKVHSLSSIKQG